MKNFFTAFLKVIVVASFVAVLSFIVLVLVNNVNVPYDAYGFIASSQQSASYDTLADRVDRYVRKFESDTSTNMVRDEYALFLNDAMLVLNNGIDYYVDYLSIEKNLSKSEQSTLIKSYKKYKEAYEYSKSCYNDYMELLYEILGDEGFDHHWTSDDIAKRTFLTSREEAFRYAYKDAYVAGSSFYKTLVNNVRHNSLFYTLTFNPLLSTIKVAYADEAVQELFGVRIISVDTSQCVRDFYKAKVYGKRSSDYGDHNMLIYNEVTLFVHYSSELDMFSLIDDYDDYIKSLKFDKKEKAVYCHNFLVEQILQR